MSGYPVVLQLAGKECLIVGGGPAAERKARGMLDGGADRLTVVSPELVDGIESLAASGRLQLRRRPYRHGDVKGMFLIVAATGLPEVDDAVMEEARQAGALFSHVSDGQAGDFHAAAAVRRGGLLLAVSTGGASPALASLIREELQQLYGEPYGEALLQLAELRTRLQEQEASESERRRRLRSEAERLRVWAAQRSREMIVPVRAEGEGTT